MSDNLHITIVHGQSHKGSTYHIAHMLAEKIGGEITEFFLPRDFGEFCVGCTGCIKIAEKNCPHYEKLQPLTQALDDADVIILASPVYVYHSTGAMKAWLDHYGYRWMIHRPEERMFSKQAVCISTAAGAGMRSTNKDMADSLFWWGIPQIYRFGIAVAAMNWNAVKPDKMRKIEQQTDRIAEKIKKRAGHVPMSMKTRLFFNAMRMMQKKSGWNPPDVAYWKQKGWIENKRPWH